MTPTEKDWRTLEDYQHSLQCHMRLMDYDIRVSREPPDNENLCEIHFDGVVRRVRYSQAWWDAAPADKAHAVIHELAHNFTFMLMESVDRAMDTLGLAGLPIKKLAHDLEDTTVVDAFALVLVPLLPKWPVEK